MTATISVAQVEAALKIASGFNWKATLAAFQSGTTQDKIVDGLIAVDDVLKIAALGFPPLAIPANYLEVGIEAYEIGTPLIKRIIAFPAPDMTGKINVMGSILDDPNYKGKSP